MFNIIALGNLPSFSLQGNDPPQLRVLRFADYKEFMSCRLIIDKLDAFLLYHEQSPQLIAELKAAYPETVIVVVHDAITADLAQSCLQAGATDIIYKEASHADIVHRLIARLIAFNSRQAREQAKLAFQAKDVSTPSQLILIPS